MEPCGQLGDGTTTDRLTPVSVSLGGAKATAIAAGMQHSLAIAIDPRLGLSTTGRVLAWGYNGDGELGDGTTTNRLKPVRVHQPIGTTAAAVSAGQYHTLAR